MRYTRWVLKVTRWVRLTTLVAGIGAVSGVACGGRSETSSDQDQSTGSHGSSSSGDSAATGNTATGSNDDDDDGLDDDLELGECVKGWPVFEADCPWLGSDNLCYATKADACACLCPRDTRSTCVSGLPGGPDDETAVSCF